MASMATDTVPRRSYMLQDPLASWGKHLASAKNLCCLIDVWGRTKYRTHTGDFDSYNPGSLTNEYRKPPSALFKSLTNLGWRISPTRVAQEILLWKRPWLEYFWDLESYRCWLAEQLHEGAWPGATYKGKGSWGMIWENNSSHDTWRRMIDAILEWRDTIGGVHNFHQHVYIVWKTE